jgi:hypothetical protein
VAVEERIKAYRYQLQSATVYDGPWSLERPEMENWRVLKVYEQRMTGLRQAAKKLG